MFLKQTNNYDCGPVAVINWLKIIAPDNDLFTVSILRKLLGTTKEGTSALNIFSLALTINPDTSYIIGRRTLPQALKHLDSGRPIMFAYQIKHAHIVTVVKRGRRYLITNFSKKEGHVTATKNSLRAMVKKSTCPAIFILL